MFDDFGFDTNEPEPTLPEEACSPYEPEPVDNNLYDANADAYPPAYLDDAAEEAQDGLLGDAALSSFDAASSDNLDAASHEETSPHSSSNPNAEKNHAAKIPFGGSGRCKLCDCRAFLWPTYGNICKNCGHHRDHHY